MIKYCFVMYMEYYSDIMKDSSHYGDILAIPFFAMLIGYFYKVEHKSGLEYVLLYFSICGFLLDIMYTFLFIYGHDK